MTYKIIRHYKSGIRKTIKEGLTLEDAQAHCSREDTAGENWFDGYHRESIDNPLISRPPFRVSQKV